MLLFRNPILCTAPAGSSFHKLSVPAHKAGYLATDWLLKVLEMFYQSEVGCCNINTPVELHLAQIPDSRLQLKEPKLLSPLDKLKLQHTTSVLLFAVLVVFKLSIK